MRVRILPYYGNIKRVLGVLSCTQCSAVVCGINLVS